MKTLTRLMMFASLALVGCGGTAASTARMGATQAAIRSAGEVGAEQEPTAALHLQYAREQFTQAEQLSRSGEGERAERVLARAEADAELALALSRRSASISAAGQAASEVREARSRPTPTSTPTPPAAPPTAPQPTP
ncbi:MAG: DUF4398 domain-containing protein [Deltaproteobacteria bacterium]|nr:DUF4398 domain-containing protein [Deltaproteobacteria bacterium]MBP6831428.1 DUF4398 domain-containing protein [Deltaproteobacteria bacterium]